MPFVLPLRDRRGRALDGRTGRTVDEGLAIASLLPALLFFGALGLLLLFGAVVLTPPFVHVSHGPPERWTFGVVARTAAMAAGGALYLAVAALLARRDRRGAALGIGSLFLPLVTLMSFGLLRVEPLVLALAGLALLAVVRPPLR